METSVTEIANKIYRISTYVEQADLRFNQYLLDADQPLIFHTGLLRLFPLGLISGGTSDSVGEDSMDFIRSLRS